MESNHIRLCAWAGPVFVLLMLTGYALTGALPPVDPQASAEMVAGYYQEHLMSIRTGLVLMVFGAAFYVPFMAGVIVQMCRMKRVSPTMIVCFSLVCAAVTLGLFVILVTWGVASYRPEASAEITRAFHDFTFLFLLWPGTLLPISYLSLGLAILADTAPDRVFPRWFAFYSFWSALLALTGCFILFFKTGPFALDGLLAFWVNLSVFFAWYVVMAVLLLRASYRQTGESEMAVFQGVREMPVASVSD